MKNIVILTLTLLCSLKALACTCDPPSPAIEFLNSKYVFEGIVISKTYPADSLSYTVTFDIAKHYKDGDSPKQLNFTFRSEGRYHGEITSCDWDVNKDETWLIYAYRHQGKLTFGYCSSNSKPLGIQKIYPVEQRILDHGNDFDPSRYIFTSFDGIDTDSRPANNIRDLLIKHQPSANRKNRFIIVVDVDETGRLISAKSDYKLRVIRDSVFNLPIAESLTSRQQLNQHEKEILKQVRQYKKWKIAYIPHSTTAVKYRRYFHLYY